MANLKTANPQRTERLPSELFACDWENLKQIYTQMEKNSAILHATDLVPKVEWRHVAKKITSCDWL